MYKEKINFMGEKIIILEQNAVMISFSENVNNMDYQDYLAWLADGNTPEPWNPEEK